MVSKISIYHLVFKKTYDTAMFDSLPDHLHQIVDVPDVESSIPAQVAYLTLLVQQLLQRSQDNNNQRTPHKN
jgi:hypothetical protein